MKESQLYIDKSDDKVDKCNNTYHRTVKIKPTDVKTYINSDAETTDKDPEFKVGDHVRISKQNHFCKRLYFKLLKRSFCYLSLCLLFYIFSSNSSYFFFKNYEKCFLFPLKSSFCSHDIQLVVIFYLPSYTLKIQEDR